MNLLLNSTSQRCPSNYQADWLFIRRGKERKSLEAKWPVILQAHVCITSQTDGLERDCNWVQTTRMGEGVGVTLDSSE